MYYCESAKKLLVLYNKKNDTKLTIKDFFYNVFVPLFYGDGVSLMWIFNSPYNQPSDKDETIEFKNEKFIKKITEGKIDGSVFVGGPAENDKSASRTQFENIYFTINEELTYQSWIGHALSIMVNGGFCLSINDDDLIWLTYKGWYEYKKLIKSDLKIIPNNKINNWNTIWLLKNDSKVMFDGFNYDDYLIVKKNKKKELKAEFKTQFWGKVLFVLSRIAKNKDVILTYVYQLGQQNKTIGFIPITIKDNRRLITAYVGLFGKDNYVKNKNKIEELYGGFYYNFERVCENGSIGFKCLRPAYEQIKNKQIKDKKIKKDKDTLDFLTYKTWIMELLKSKIEHMNELSEDVPNYLIDFMKRTTKTMKSGNSEKRNFVEEFLETNNRNRLIKHLATLAREDSGSKEIVNQIKDIALKFGNEDISMMMNLIKITYYQKQTNK